MTQNITITEYTEKSIVIRGDTLEYKEELLNLGGKWNTKLRDGEGWIFPKTKYDKLNEWLINIKSGNNKSEKKIYNNNSNLSLITRVKILSEKLETIQKELFLIYKELDSTQKPNMSYCDIEIDDDADIITTKRLLKL